jgi:ABC-type bacteriocin/lantibiotic exporter with double-glycine peptidase domain
VTQEIVEQLYRLMHIVVWIHTPGDQRWILPIFVLVLVIAPTWLGLQVLRIGSVTLIKWRRQAQSYRKDAAPGSPNITKISILLENFVLRRTCKLQIRIVILSLIALPLTYVQLLLPKLIVNQVLADNKSTTELFIINSLAPVKILLLLCTCYLLVLIVSSLIKYTANVVRGKIHERIVRHIRLSAIRRRRDERCPRARSTLAAVAIQECEPIGYFGGSLLLVPLIQGGTFITSLLFLFFQDIALAFAALIMLPLQIAVLPRLQRQINSKVRERVHMTRVFNESLTQEEGAGNNEGLLSPTRFRIRQTAAIEGAQIEISKLKSRFKCLYNFTTNLTPFFFFSIGGYLVLQQRLSLGALVAALAAYREIAPALRELFDFARNWSDARARYAEVIAVV